MIKKVYIQISLFTLLLIFVFNNFGYWFCFKAEQASVKQEMFQRTKQNLSNNELTAVVVSSDETKDIAWADKNEFSYKGEMYDVVRVEKNGNNTIYYCLTDTKEEALYADLDSHLNNNLLGGKTSGKRSTDILKLFTQQYFNVNTQFYFFDNAPSTIRPGSQTIYSSVQLDILCPPPDHLS